MALEPSNSSSCSSPMSSSQLDGMQDGSAAPSSDASKNLPTMDAIASSGVAWDSSMSSSHRSATVAADDCRLYLRERERRERERRVS